MTKRNYTIQRVQGAGDYDYDSKGGRLRLLRETITIVVQETTIRETNIQAVKPPIQRIITRFGVGKSYLASRLFPFR